MSEQMSAEIWIGGKISARLVLKLCETIAQQCVICDWGDGSFHPHTADELLAVCRENAKGVRLLWFCDDQARWGEFEVLEAFLQRHKIAYTRRSDGKWEYEPTLVEYRPPRSLFVFTTNNAGEVVVPASKLADALSQIPSRISPATSASSARAVAAVLRGLHKTLPPQVPPLEPFEIVRRQDRRTARGNA